MNNDDTVSEDLAFNAELITQALAGCRDPDHRAIFERGLIALDRIAARAYGGQALRFFEDWTQAIRAGNLATAYSNIEQASAVHAEKMNARKGQALREAITAVLRDDNSPAAVEEAWKKAQLILGEVNKRLKKQGHKPATRKSVYDQLKNFLRS